MRKGQKNSFGKFDPEFRFLLELDPALDGWRAWAAEYWTPVPNSSQNFLKTALTGFFVRYLHAQDLHRLPPDRFFDRTTTLPAFKPAISMDIQANWEANRQHDHVSDFLDWVLREKLAEMDADGHRMVPPHLANPFPRRRIKRHGKQSDLEFSYVLLLDPKLDEWRRLAAEWLKDQTHGVDGRREALEAFFLRYLHAHGLERNYGRFLLRDTPKPDFAQALVAGKKQGTQTLNSHDVRFVNCVAEWLDWVLATKLGDEETGEWDRARFHNPVVRLTRQGMVHRSESDKTPLSICYIKELRGMLAEGPSFGDWIWAQQAIGTGSAGGDWFVVDPLRIDPEDPDCVYRERETSPHERNIKKYPGRVVEMWSPVRAMALYLMLELPLRSHQVRMLDSGEADTYRFVYGPDGGGFVLNHSRMATGSEARPYQRGVFHRTRSESGAGLFINTNKTADINKAEKDKGYVIPWAHDQALYWLDKLRNWQERYNPITAPTAWTELEAKHWGRTPPHPAVMAQRGEACFLFRGSTVGDGGRPLERQAPFRLWYLLLQRLEQRCAKRGEGLDDGTPLRFVDPDSPVGSHFPLHALRVSLITYLVLDLNLPLAVVSKLIAGHATILMTLYYTKSGRTYMHEVLSEAEKREFEANQANHRRFFMDATVEQIGQRFASLSEDAPRAVVAATSAAAFLFEDKGICTVGGTKCDVGGEKLGGETHNNYAPVPGYPQERNCVRCRFFLTGPAFLPGLTAHFNCLSEKGHRQSKRYQRITAKVEDLEDVRSECERTNAPFLQVKDLERTTQRMEAEEEAMGKLLNDWQATFYLIERSKQIANSTDPEGIKLVSTGRISDIQVGFIETESELHLLEVIAQNAVLYECEADYPILRRAQMLDAMLCYNGMSPLLMHMTPEEQLLAGNALMKLIQARTGSIKDSLPYAECRLKLKELGVIGEEIHSEITAAISAAPMRQLLEHAKSELASGRPPTED